MVQHPWQARGTWVPHGDRDRLDTVWCTWERLPPRPKVFRGVLPRRWVVDRTFGWFGQSRPLSKDYDASGLAGPVRQRASAAESAQEHGTLSPFKRLAGAPIWYSDPHKPDQLIHLEGLREIGIGPGQASLLPRPPIRRNQQDRKLRAAPLA